MEVKLYKWTYLVTLIFYIISMIFLLETNFKLLLRLFFNKKKKDGPVQDKEFVKYLSYVVGHKTWII